MSEFVKQQSIIWFRIIATILLVGIGKFVWDLNTTMVKMAHNTATIAETVGSIADQMDTMRRDINNNTLNIAVHDTRINNLEGKHD